MGQGQGLDHEPARGSPTPPVSTTSRPHTASSPGTTSSPSPGAATPTAGAGPTHLHGRGYRPHRPRIGGEGPGAPALGQACATRPSSSTTLVCPQCNTRHTVGHTPEEKISFCSQCGYDFDNKPVTLRQLQQFFPLLAGQALTAAAFTTAGSTTSPIDATKAKNNQYAQTVSRAPDRSDLAPVAHSMLKQAREGKLPPSIQTLLPMASSYSAGTFSAIEGVGIQIVGDTVKALTDKPQGKRREVTDFSHISEALIHGFIGNWYPDDPDLCREALGLHSLALDIHRRHGFRAALLYCNAVLERRYLSHHRKDAAPNLQQQGAFSMADFHIEYLGAAVLTQQAGPAQPLRNAGPGTSNPTPPGPGTKRPVCLNWNKGWDCKNNPCTYSHLCKTCGGKHAATECTRTATTPAPQDSTRRGDRGSNQ